MYGGEIVTGGGERRRRAVCVCVCAVLTSCSAVTRGLLHSNLPHWDFRCGLRQPSNVTDAAAVSGGPVTESLRKGGVG